MNKRVERFSFTRWEGTAAGHVSPHPTGEYVMFNDYDSREGELLAEIDRLRVAYGMDTPWPLHDVLATLIEATEHLLNHHMCDTHRHEAYRTAVNSGYMLLNARGCAEEAKP